MENRRKTGRRGTGRIVAAGALACMVTAIATGAAETLGRRAAYEERADTALALREGHTFWSQAHDSLESLAREPGARR